MVGKAEYKRKRERKEGWKEETVSCMTVLPSLTLGNKITLGVGAFFHFQFKTDCGTTRKARAWGEVPGGFCINLECWTLS